MKALSMDHDTKASKLLTVGDPTDVEAELKEARRLVAETTAKLEAKETAMSDLTEHFLQVYQIANELAVEVDNTGLELRQLQLLSDKLKDQVVERDSKIAELEGRPFDCDSAIDGLSDVSTEFANNRCSSAQGDDTWRSSHNIMHRPRSSSCVSRSRSPLNIRGSGRCSLERPSPKSLMTSLSLRLDGPKPSSRIPRPPCLEPTTRRTQSLDGHHFIDNIQENANSGEEHQNGMHDSSETRQ